MPIPHSSNWMTLLKPYELKLSALEKKVNPYWYFLLDGQEVGPLKLEKALELTQGQKPPLYAFGYHTGLKHWTPLSHLKEFKNTNFDFGFPFMPSEEDLIIEKEAHRRSSFRKSICASVSSSKNFVGICLNISLDGFQMVNLMHPLRRSMDSRIDIEIKPLSLLGMATIQSPAILKWVDHDKNLYGFKFDQMDPMELVTLKSYFS